MVYIHSLARHDMLRRSRARWNHIPWSCHCWRGSLLNPCKLALKMVRTKNLSAATGRKQRIEGIVKNLSAKALAAPCNLDEKHTEPMSVLGVRERMDSRLFSTTTRSDPVETGKSYILWKALPYFTHCSNKELKFKQHGAILIALLWFINHRSILLRTAFLLP